MSIKKIMFITIGLVSFSQNDLSAMVVGASSTASAFKRSPSSLSSPKVGGAKDAHGCYTTAGYTWCEASKKCIRPWELANNLNGMGILQEDGSQFDSLGALVFCKHPRNDIDWSALIL